MGLLIVKRVELRRKFLIDGELMYGERVVGKKSESWLNSDGNN